MSKTSLLVKDEEQASLVEHECSELSSSPDTAHCDLGRSASLDRPPPMVSFKDARHHEQEQMRQQAPSPPILVSQAPLFHSPPGSTSRRLNHMQRSWQNWSTSWMMQLSGVVVILLLVGVIALTFKLHKRYKEPEKSYVPGLNIMEHDSSDPSNKSAIGFARHHHDFQLPAETGRFNALSVIKNASIRNPNEASHFEVKATIPQDLQSNQPEVKAQHVEATSTNVPELSSVDGVGIRKENSKNVRSLVRMNRTALVKAQDLQLLKNG
ncbi:hypothetical protein MTO96_009354 [Rhipicephalus appendiculatus]